eukprot:1715965-Pyramimonas_sp.AAC.1
MLREKRDHLPVFLEIPRPSFARQEQQTCQQPPHLGEQRLHPDAMMAALRGGVGLRDFLDGVEGRMEAQQQEWMRFARQDSPDRLFQYLEQ